MSTDIEEDDNVFLNGGDTEEEQESSALLVVAFQEASRYSLETDTTDNDTLDGAQDITTIAPANSTNIARAVPRHGGVSGGIVVFRGRIGSHRNDFYAEIRPLALPTTSPTESEGDFPLNRIQESKSSFLQCPMCATRHYVMTDNRKLASPEFKCSHGATLLFVAIECPICMEHRVEPPNAVVLGCGHVLCRQDFEQLGGLVQAPRRQEQLPSPPPSREHLTQPSLFLGRVVEGHLQQQGIGDPLSARSTQEQAGVEDRRHFFSNLFSTGIRSTRAMWNPRMEETHDDDRR